MMMACSRTGSGENSPSPLLSPGNDLCGSMKGIGRRTVSTTSSAASATTNVVSRENLQLQVLQDEVSCLNELACTFFESGKYRDATVHYFHGLDAIKKVSKLKREILGKNVNNPNSKATLRVMEENDRSFELHASERRPGSLLLPVDSESNVWECIHWETVSSVVLMHNSAMVHFKLRHYAKAKQMLDLARGMLKANLSQKKSPYYRSLHQLLERNRYVVSVVASLYTFMGRVMMKLSKQHKSHTNQHAHCQAKAKQAYSMAASLLKRYQENDEEDDEDDDDMDRDNTFLRLPPSRLNSGGGGGGGRRERPLVAVAAAASARNQNDEEDDDDNVDNDQELFMPDLMKTTPLLAATMGGGGGGHSYGGRNNNSSSMSAFRDSMTDGASISMYKQNKRINQFLGNGGGNHMMMNATPSFLDLKAAAGLNSKADKLSSNWLTQSPSAVSSGSSSATSNNKLKRSKHSWGDLLGAVSGVDGSNSASMTHPGLLSSSHDYNMMMNAASAADPLPLSVQ